MRYALTAVSRSRQPKRARTRQDGHCGPGTDAVTSAAGLPNWEPWNRQSVLAWRRHEVRPLLRNRKALVNPTKDQLQRHEDNWLVLKRLAVAGLEPPNDNEVHATNATSLGERYAYCITSRGCCGYRCCRTGARRHLLPLSHRFRHGRCWHSSSTMEHDPARDKPNP